MSLDLDNVTQKFLRIGKGLIGVLLGMLAFVVIIVPIFLIRGCETDEGTDEARRLQRLEILEESKQQEQDLHKLEFIDQQAGTVHLPIENAMAATILDLQGQEVSDSGVSAANWVPPQLPSWADAPPLYTLTTEEQIPAPRQTPPADGEGEAETETETDTESTAETETQETPGEEAAPEDVEGEPRENTPPAAESEPEQNANPPAGTQPSAPEDAASEEASAQDTE